MLTNFFLSKLGVTGLPEHLLPNRVLVQMRDQSIFEGNIEHVDSLGQYLPVPFWMQPVGAKYAKDDYFFIRTESGYHFLGALDFSGQRLQHRPYPRGPERAEIHLGNEEYFTARDFRLYRPTQRHSFHKPNYPPINHIYVAMEGGPVYSARLIRHIPSPPRFGETSQTDAHLAGRIL